MIESVLELSTAPATGLALYIILHKEIDKLKDCLNNNYVRKDG